MAKTHSLTKLSLALAVCYAGSQSAFAEIHAADGNTQVSKKSGVEIINIAAPSQSGLSHNKYDKFNVDKKGAVLNNSRENGSSHLAGDLHANPNLKTHAATVILNEVVSRNPSKIAGKQEIFGEKADYVLANPNGISANGAGFINTPRASLVVGKPKVEHGKLTGYDVTGEKALSATGKITSKGDVDLIAPQVNVDGHLSTSEGINIIAGRNKIARDDEGTLTITSVEQKGKVLDGKIAGSIQAGRIRIHSTDERATVNTAAADLEAEEITIAAGNVKLKGKTTTHTSGSPKHYQDPRKINTQETEKNSTQTYQATNIKSDKLELHVTNKIDISGANIDSKDASIIGGSVHLGAEKTVNSKQHSKNESKGLWYRNQGEQQREETVHRTTVSGEDVKIVATKGQVTGEGAKISMNEGGIYGEKGVNLRGATATVTSAAQADFKNETAKLKTGSSSQNAVEQKYTASELNVDGAFVLGGKGDINLAGVVGHIDGDLIVKNEGKTTFTAEKTKESYNLHDDHKFWGGLAGSKTVGSGRNAETIHGSDLSVKGEVLIDAQKGVNISGSRVISGEDGVVKGNKGKLVIDSVYAKEENSEHSRVGTIFDITKARQSSYSRTSTAHGSTLKSSSNLKLSADKTISIIGSNVAAECALDIASLSGIDIRGAKNYHYEHSEEAGFNLGLRFDSLKANIDKGHVSAQINVENNEHNKPTVSGDVTVSKHKKPHAVSGEVAFSAGLHVYNNQNDAQSITHTASEVSGGDVALSAKKVVISGSDVGATSGDLNIDAKKIVTQAQHDQTITNSVNNNVDVGLQGKIGTKEVGVGLGVEVDHRAESTVKNDARISTLWAEEDINLNARKIHHKGTEIEAGEDVVENAKVVIHDTAKSDESSHSNYVNVGAGVNVAVNACCKTISADASIHGNGGNQQNYSSSHQGTVIKAEKNIDVNAKKIHDTATQYEAGEDVNLHSKKHTITSAQNEKHSNSLDAGASLGLSASVNKAHTVNVGVDANVNYAREQSASSTAVQSNIKGENVYINTGKLNSQANIHAAENVEINAKHGANFTQSNNTASYSGGNIDVGLGVGATIAPSSSVVVPSVDFKLKGGGHKGTSTEAVTSTISGKNVDIHSDGVTSIQGTHVEAEEDNNISGKKVIISASESSTKELAGNGGLGVSVGEDVSSLGVSGNLGVKHENTKEHGAVNINGEYVNIQADKGITLNGVNSESKWLHLDSGEGNLVLNAPQNQVNKTDFNASLDLNGDLEHKKWAIGGGSASLDVNAVRNQTHTGTTFKTEEAEINVGGNAIFNGGSIKADSATGTIAGNSHSETLTNKINETSVSLSAKDNGKLSNGWEIAAKKEWDSNSIGGVVKAKAKVDVNAKRQTTHTKAGIKATRNHVAVHGQKTRNKPAPTQHKVVTAKAKVAVPYHNVAHANSVKVHFGH